LWRESSRFQPGDHDADCPERGSSADVRGSLVALEGLGGLNDALPTMRRTHLQGVCQRAARGSHAPGPTLGARARAAGQAAASVR
jgi:hypothetical protein